MSNIAITAIEQLNEQLPGAVVEDTSGERWFKTKDTENYPAGAHYPAGSYDVWVCSHGDHHSADLILLDATGQLTLLLAGVA